MATPVQHGTHGDQEFRAIALTQLHESKHNPRRHFDEAKLKELAESIGKIGILTPLLVRPNEKGFEIAAGHRRYRAAKAIQLADVPCLVRELDDQAFMEILTIENLQREDVHPLDEAAGYEALKSAPYKMPVEKIAERVGRSVKYIYDRVKLLALVKEAGGFFWSGKISAGHAILLARLTPAQQRHALGTRAEGYEDGGVFQAERGLPFDSSAAEDDQFKAVSVRELEAWIDDHVRFDRKAIDPMLFPKTAEKVQAACATPDSDPKKSVIPITYSFVLNDHTRDTSERTYTERAWKRADGLEGSKTCEYARLGCVVAGAHRGESFDVCIDKKLCVVHWKNEVKAAARRANGITGHAATNADAADEARRRKQEEEYERQQRRREAWEKNTPAIQKLVDQQLLRAPTKATGRLGDLLINALSDWRRAKTAVPRGKTADDLVRHLAGLVLSREVRGHHAYDTFPKLAKGLGFDITKALPAVQTSARKKKGKAA